MIAARTYALRAALAADDAATPAHVNFCATDHCQVYLGAGAEYPALTRAVKATNHVTVSYQHRLAATYYSASGGGETATPAEGFGPSSTAVPYLAPVAYDTGGGDGWERSLDPTAAAHSLGYAGSLTSIEVTARGPSSRVTAVVLHGSAGDEPMTGIAVEAALQLPSTLFDTGVGLPAPTVDAVAGVAATGAALLVAFPANQPAAVQGVPAVPLPEVAPAEPAARAAPTTSPGASDVIVSEILRLTPLSLADQPGFIPTMGPTRQAADQPADNYRRAYLVLLALLVLLSAAGAGAAWHHRRS